LFFAHIDFAYSAPSCDGSAGQVGTIGPGVGVGERALQGRQENKSFHELQSGAAAQTRVPGQAFVFEQLTAHTFGVTPTPRERVLPVR
jgi:hypothetical protein